MASFPTKVHMLDIKHYNEIGYPKIHLRLYGIVVRAHRLDDGQLVVIFPMSLSGATQRQFALVKPSRLRTWNDVAHEFFTQFASNVDIDVSIRQLEATRQRSDKFISSFVSCWRAKVVGMVDWPKEQNHIDMVLRNLQPRFDRRLMGIPFQNLKSLVQEAFNVEQVIAEGLWTNIVPSPNSKGKRPIRSSKIYGEIDSISYQHQRLAHYSYYRFPTVRAHLFHLQPYIAQASMQLRPSPLRC